MSSPQIAVINCREVVTLAGPARPRRGAEMRELGIVPNGGVWIRDGRIEEVGPSQDIERRISPGCEVIDAGGRILLPGFVDAHTHPVFAGTRVDEVEQRVAGASYEQIAAAGGGIRSTVRRTREATELELFEVSRRYSDWFVRCGTTTVEAKSGYGLNAESELKILRVIRALGQQSGLRYVPTFLGAHVVPQEYQRRRQEYVYLLVHELVPQVAAEQLAMFCDVFCEAGAFNLEESERVLRTAQQAGLGLRIHADQLTNGGGALLAAQLRAATADHLEHTGPEGIAALAAANVQPVLLPGAALTLGSRRYAAAREMTDAGLAVVIATDFNPGT